MTPPAAHPSVVPLLASLQQDLASLIRVRNRLAQTPDIKLPHVLTGLLPRLLTRLDHNTRALYSNTAANDAELELRQKMEVHLTGMVAHTVERIRGNLHMSVPWVEPVFQVLNALETAVALTLTLTILQTALSRIDTLTVRPSSASMTVSLVRFVDKLYGSMEAQRLTKSGQLHSRTAGWLFWNTIGLHSGLKALGDWDAHDWDEHCSWHDLGQASPASSKAALAVSQDGSGVMELLLDILLFWPPTTSRIIRRDETVDNSTGLSIEGLARVNHPCKGSLWNEVYLRQLKYACLRYAVWPLNQGILQGAMGPDRARLLCILTVSGGSMHGRLAALLLNQYDGISRLRKQDKGWTDAQVSCSLDLSVCLLVLILGDAAATPVLAEYADQRHLWEPLLGPRPSEHTLQRDPLPIIVACRATDYIRDHFRPPAGLVAKGERDIRLFVDLVVAVLQQDHRGVYWGIRLMEGMYFQLQEAKFPVDHGDWTTSFYNRCLLTAGDVLASMSTIAEDQGPPRRAHAANLPGGVPAPFGRRTDLNHLLSTHRLSQKKKHLQLDSAIRARTTAYDMIAALCSATCEDHDSKLSFKLPSLILKCAGKEDDAMQPHVTRALESLLQVYIQLGTARLNRAETIVRHHLVAPLLPSLLLSASSESPSARLATVRWCTELVAMFDPPVATHICRYLAEDPDGMVAALATRAIPQL